MGENEYLAAFDAVVMPVARSFGPNLVVVSAGFDAAKGDPVGGMSLGPLGFAAMTSRLRELAGGRVVLVLEGGYKPAAASKAVQACVRVLLDDPSIGGLPRCAHKRLPDPSPNSLHMSLLGSSLDYVIAGAFLKPASPVSCEAPLRR